MGRACRTLWDECDLQSGPLELLDRTRVGIRAGDEPVDARQRCDAAVVRQPQFARVCDDNAARGGGEHPALHIRLGQVDIGDTGLDIHSAAPHKGDVGMDVFDHRPGEWVDERVLQRAKRAAGDDDTEPRDRWLERKRDIERVGDDHDVVQLTSREQRRRDGRGGRSHIEHDGLAGLHERSRCDTDGTLLLGGRVRGLLERLLRRGNRRQRDRSAMDSLHDEIPGESIQVGSGGDLRDAEPVAELGDASETLLVDDRADAFATHRCRQIELSHHGFIVVYLCFLVNWGTVAFDLASSWRPMPHISKHERLMADGRELIYFDDADTTLGPERAADVRTLEPRPDTPDMRQDPLTGEWISIAKARQNRVFLPPSDRDPLAPYSAINPSEIPDNYDVVVFENRSPSFGPALSKGYGDVQLTEIGVGRSLPAIGRCEVVCFSPQSTGSFSGLTPSRARTVIEAWADRTAALSALPGIREVFPFENRGEAIGVTLHHPHGQIYAYPYVTPRTQRLLASIESFDGDLFASILEFEAASERVVLRGEHWIAFVPFAARWPLEVHVLPVRHVADFAGTTEAERDELAGLYLRLLRGVDRLYSTPTPYIAAWHQAPSDVGRDTVRLMLQLTSPRRAEDKLKYLAGSESAMGAWIGDVVPEVAASGLREAIAQADAS